MKKMTLYLMVMVLSLSTFTAPVMASERNVPTTNTAVPAEVAVMYSRLETIKAMDKSNMSSAEKKALRKEVRAIKSNLKATGNGVYLSVGAIIIIILLLILLL